MIDIIRLKQQEAVLRLLFQNEHKDVEKPLHAQKNVVAKRDCLTISLEAMEIQKTARIYGRSGHGRSGEKAGGDALKDQCRAYPDGAGQTAGFPASGLSEVCLGVRHHGSCSAGV